MEVIRLNIDMDINELAQKIPRPLLVGVILIVAIVFFVYNDPLRDECEIQTSIFKKKTEGILSATKKNKKTQFAQLNYWSQRCKEGNSIGACEDYLEGLRFVVSELREVHDNCQVKYGIEEPQFVKQVQQAIQIMALVAWGEKPPSGLGDRAGWLIESQLKTFCYMKKTLILLAGDEYFKSLREKVYREYPDKLPELKEGELEKVDIKNFTSENRPRAYKTAANPSGSLTKEQIYERSIFSVRCDLYM